LKHRTMIKHFFTSIYRNILKDKIFSLINLTNLTIGFTTFIRSPSTIFQPTASLTR